MNNEDLFKKIYKNNTSNILLIIFTSIFIFSLYIYRFIMINEFGIESHSNESYFRFILNVILVIMAIISCLLFYDGTKKEEIFIISLMYIMFGIDILNSRTTGYLNDTLPKYHAIATSFIRILIVYISVSNLKKIKQKIMNNKYKSLYIVTIISFICIYIEHLYLFPYNQKIIEFYKQYNLVLIVLYIIIAFKYFKRSIIKNDYIYGVVGSSTLLFSIKSIYDYYGLINPSPEIYFIGYSAIILSFIIYILGLFIELNKSMDINKALDEQKNLFVKITDENKHRNVIICDENYIIKYKNKKAQQSIDQMAPIIKVRGYIGDKLDLEKVFNYKVNIEEIELEIESNKSYRKNVYLEADDSILDFSIHLFDVAKEKFKVITITDISAKYKLEKALIEYEIIKKEEIIKNEFFSNISHELKTPLNVIYSTNQLLNSSIEKDDFKYTYIKYSEAVNINCKRMLRLIDNIVDITKLDVGYKNPNFQNYNIVNIVEDMTLSIVNYAKVKDINIVFDTDIEELNIKLDLNMLERIVLNLLSNAIKFSKKNSTVTVKIFSNKEWVGIKIIDNGIGIDPEIQSKIFERFVQGDKSIRRKNEGSGIGLSLVKSFVDLMDGKIYVQSDGHSGSTFTVLLPNQIILDNGSITYNDYNVDKERIKLEFSDIYELFEDTYELVR